MGVSHGLFCPFGRMSKQKTRLHHQSLRVVNGLAGIGGDLGFSDILVMRQQRFIAVVVQL
jgi:hypothetical protein